MDKQEQTVVHRFLITLYEYLDEEKNEDIEIPDEYDEHGVYPTHMHKTKKDHQEAIRILRDHLEEEMERIND